MKLICSQFKIEESTSSHYHIVNLGNSLPQESMIDTGLAGFKED